MYRGLRQGDPLSPFLFILAMEGFNVTLVRVQSANTLKGARVSGMEISNLLYADDAVLLTSGVQRILGELFASCIFFLPGFRFED